ncbi:MAG: preprotein translocase subunit SecA [Defluviitaleaceae bacterium]|nr:preprotein translocase subunit SecA [Defluviitaleaceae bacterium]
MRIFDKIFGSYSEKEIKRIRPIVEEVNSLESKISELSDDGLRAKTDEFRKRLANGETLNDLHKEAFAVVREAAKRTLGERHYDVQILGGTVLHQGRIAEMRTGEGKTLVSTLPAYLNALEGKGVHIVTVNDYLAKRDSEWMGQVHRFLGLTVGVILHDMKSEERREAYNCDITYATNNELGFDYLRDNMVIYKEELVQRGLNYAIIDEVDSVLIDEARTPLIISGSGNKSTSLYKVANSFARTLKKGRIVNEQEAMNKITRAELIEEGDFVVDEKAKSVSLTQEGSKKAEQYFSIENLSDPSNLEIQHHVNNALKANFNMHLDKDYVVQDGEIVIVDEFTGRLMPGRSYSDGLHQAIEAKENVTVKRESKTLATITFQNFFNRYAKKCGMTGTALTEESEFRQIYGMDVVAIPTNLPIQRIDQPDYVYKSENGKFKAVIEDIADCHLRKQPVLVGTITIEMSEHLSGMLRKQGIPHQVLNAKYHEQEAEIVALAGQPGAVTIATNMAGRGTDIKLGEGVKELGGLKIVGTERHESRRIDNQLRGRSGRQGDKGESRFYLSLEDDLMRLFGSDKVMTMVEKMGMPEDEPIEAKLLSNGIENAQRRVESNNFGVRKHLLEYDRVMNEQREIIYAERLKVLMGEDLKDNIHSMVKAVIERAIDKYSTDAEFADEWNVIGLNEFLMPIFHEAVVFIDKTNADAITKEGLVEELYEKAIAIYNSKEDEFTSERMREIERIVTLRVIDQKWMDHIDDMDQMRQGISLRAYAQRDPLLEYKFLSYDMFDELSANIQLDTVRGMFNVRMQAQMERVRVAKDMSTNMDDSAAKAPVRRKDAKIGRNDPCSCGSGKKYKACCGVNG